ncbi:FliC/FljB family flagellin [Polynucleobacter sp. HIN8]|uniref:flagellin N-terminal helical domain-containing protein n=1 Tax=Polynucleobacter sp. HIN8 TaxID=3047867 RepID=UPI002572B7F8|nr:flagellin [Polynucleobacter sp. HIN8]BEI39592.1 FliC/FljB family flagellin [Polynucleobacter sp. HIN8]
MPTVINTNLASLFAQNSLNNAQNNLAQSVQRLSSGLRINSAKDDAAGLSIAQNMQSQINGTNQSVQNLNNATNLLQVADNSLATIQDMLLKLKQLATQGYDGSLSNIQRQAIVTQMQDLNDEINKTAARTQFNQINLLSSGSTVDTNNSSIEADKDMVFTVTSISTGGLLQSGTLNAATLGGGSGTYTTTLSNSFTNKLAGQAFILSSSGANLTLTGTIDGNATSQTVVVNNFVGAGSSTSSLQSQTLDFSDFGVKVGLQISVTGTGTITGTTIASTFASSAIKTLTVNGSTSTVSDVRLSGMGPGTYAISSSMTSGTVTMTGTINGNTVAQTLTLGTFAANTTTTLDFSSFGAQFDIKTYAVAASAGQIANALSQSLYSGTNVTGSFVVSKGANSDLQFQSGPASDSFINIYTVNVQTATSGAYAGAASQMTTLGTRITSTTSGNLGGLTANDDVADWQAAFQRAAAAADNAIDYISTQRATYGSQMNRLSYVSTNLREQSTNLQNSRSAIIDTDFASETAKLTRGQIMQQAATAMLAQANQMPNVVLALLK